MTCHVARRVGEFERRLRRDRREVSHALMSTDAELAELAPLHRGAAWPREHSEPARHARRRFRSRGCGRCPWAVFAWRVKSGRNGRRAHLREAGSRGWIRIMGRRRRLRRHRRPAGVEGRRWWSWSSPTLRRDEGATTVNAHRRYSLAASRWAHSGTITAMPPATWIAPSRSSTPSTMCPRVVT